MNSQVDMLALVEEEKRMGEGLMALALAYYGREPDDHYWRTVLIFSYPFFRLGAVSEGMQVLGIIPPTYLRGALMKHMEADRDLAGLAEQIADTLITNLRAPAPHLDVDARKVNVQSIGRA